MSIYTKGGDKGETSLLGGIRVPKDSLRIEVYGTLDEVTSALGMARAVTGNDDLADIIYDLQGELIDVMGELATDPAREPKSGAQIPLFKVEPSHVAHFEALIDKFEKERIPQHKFIRPGGTQAAAAMDMARTFVRRTERRLIALGRQETVNPNLFRYLNRLSDLLYVMARLDEQRDITKQVRKALENAGMIGKSQGGNMQGLDLERSEYLIAAGIRKAESIGIPVVLSVVDPAGQMIAFKRMDNALGVSVTLSPHKAYTAAMVRMATKDINDLMVNDGPFIGLDINMDKLTRVGGGIPILHQNILMGAVGVSGGSVDQDVEIARAMVEAFTV